MREYFLHLLQHLDKLTGIKQYDKLCQHPDWKKELNLLLDILCRVADQFQFIPEEAKRRIIDTNVVTDQEFIGLNAKIVFKWLQMNKDLYFKELAHQEVKPENEPLVGEARDKRIKEVLDQLARVQEPMANRTNLYSHVIKQIQPSDGQKYRPVSDEYVANSERHLKWIKTCFNPKTGKKNTDWIDEKEFNKLYDEGLI